MPGTYRIELADCATPVVYSPRKIPALKREKELKRKEKLGVMCAKKNDRNAPEIFQRTMDQMVEDLDGVEVIMNDLVISGDDATHDEQLMKFLERTSKKGLKPNKREMQDPPGRSALCRTSTHRKGPEDYSREG